MAGWELINTQNGSNFSNIEAAFKESNNRRKTWHLTLDKAVGANGTYDPTTASSPVSQTNSTAIKFVEDLEAEEYLSEVPRNPAIFETKPKNNDNLEIYHEVSPSYDISLHIPPLEFPLDFYNCFTFGNDI